MLKEWKSVEQAQERCDGQVRAASGWASHWVVRPYIWKWDDMRRAVLRTWTETVKKCWLQGGNGVGGEGLQAWRWDGGLKHS